MEVVEKVKISDGRFNINLIAGANSPNLQHLKVETYHSKLWSSKSMEAI